jgi:hypothetical protein
MVCRGQLSPGTENSSEFFETGERRQSDLLDADAVQFLWSRMSSRVGWRFAGID